MIVGEEPSSFAPLCLRHVYPLPVRSASLGLQSCWNTIVYTVEIGDPS